MHKNCSKILGLYFLTGSCRDLNTGYLDNLGTQWYQFLRNLMMYFGLIDEIMNYSENEQPIQLRDQFVEDIPMPMEVDQTEEIKKEEFKTQEIKDELIKLEETEKKEIKIETIIQKEDIKMEDIKMEEIETENTKAEVTTTKDLRMVRRSGRRSKGNNSL